MKTKNKFHLLSKDILLKIMSNKMTPYNFKRLEIFLYNYDNKVTI